jgi:hypothetical protein
LKKKERERVRILTQSWDYLNWIEVAASQAWVLTPLPEVFTLYGDGGGIRTGVRVTIFKLAALPRFQ